MAVDMFLKIDGVDGESTDSAHKNWIEIQSFNHEIEQPTTGSVSSGGARTAERANHGDFKIVKALDKSSPKLALHCCTGKHIKSAEVELCRQTGDKQPYMAYKMSDIIIRSVMPGCGEKDGETLPVETITFSYAKIEWIYTETDNKTGKAKGDIKAYWDAAENKGG